MFPEKPFKKDRLSASLKRYQHFNMRDLELKSLISLDAHVERERGNQKKSTKLLAISKVPFNLDIFPIQIPTKIGLYLLSSWKKTKMIQCKYF